VTELSSLDLDFCHEAADEPSAQPVRPGAIVGLPAQPSGNICLLRV
jgi:hypothetical protein